MSTLGRLSTKKHDDGGNGRPKTRNCPPESEVVETDFEYESKSGNGNVSVGNFPTLRAILSHYFSF